MAAFGWPFFLLSDQASVIDLREFGIDGDHS
jgi:hypothetical protein